ncbi:MAG: PaaI family thioesterase [Microthrixaceae bacterium]
MGSHDDALTAILQSSMPLCRTLGMIAVSTDAGEVVLQLDYDETLCTAGGLMHGGALMALADSAGAMCAFLNLPEGAAGTATIESKTNMLGAVTAGVVTATARPLQVGSRIIVVETELTCDGQLVAKTIQTQIVKMPRS